MYYKTKVQYYESLLVFFCVIPKQLNVVTIVNAHYLSSIAITQELLSSKQKNNNIH